MTNAQLYLAIGVPLFFNAAVTIAFYTLLRAQIADRFDSVTQQFIAVNQRFDAIDQRFDYMRDLWRAELRRVEEVLDARLKHMEAPRP